MISVVDRLCMPMWSLTSRLSCSGIVLILLPILIISFSPDSAGKASVPHSFDHLPAHTLDFADDFYWIEIVVRPQWFLIILAHQRKSKLVSMQDTRVAELSGVETTRRWSCFWRRGTLNMIMYMLCLSCLLLLIVVEDGLFQLYDMSWSPSYILLLRIEP